jgi:hypothetical protein
MRKRHQSVDAELAVREHSVQVRYLLNGDLSYVRDCATRADAMADAATKRAELERDGWMFHW